MVGTGMAVAAQQPIQQCLPRQRVCRPQLLVLQLRSTPCCAHGVRRLQQQGQAFSNDKQPTAVDSLEDLEIAVPADQRPVNELASLKEAFLYNWVRG
jgi:hypothetical protein